MLSARLPPGRAQSAPGVRMVSEEDAAALVVRVATMLKLEGENPVITAENSVWLTRYAGLMLAGFGIGAREMTEETDGHS